MGRVTSTSSFKCRITTLFLFQLLLLCLVLFSSTVKSQETEHSRLKTSNNSSNKLERILLSLVLGVLTGLILALITALIIRCFVGYISRTPILKGPVIFSPKTLQSALANENQLLGSSPNGKYYKTALDNGLVIAVKQLQTFSECGSPEGAAQSKSAKRRVQHELEVLAGLRHRHLMSLRAYVREHDRFSLVYDYVPNGSLEDAMIGADLACGLGGFKPKKILKG